MRQLGLGTPMSLVCLGQPDNGALAIGNKGISGNLLLSDGEGVLALARGVIQSSAVPLALQGLEPYASWRKLPDEALIKPFTNSKAIHVVVTGGKIQTTWFVTDFGMRRGVLIDDWA